MRTLIYYVIMVLLLVALFCCVLAVGAVRIPLPDVCAALFGGEVKETYRPSASHWWESSETANLRKV
jgi:ABC-type Fe3+-siderophore transport system permease subunit